MKLHRAQVLAGYLIAATLVLFPLTETALAGWPPRLGSVSWRYGTGGILSRAIMTPLLGILLASAMAQFLRQVRVLRGLAVLCGLAGLILLLWTGRFFFDAMQMRGQVGSDLTARATLDATTVPAFFKLLLGTVASGLLAAGNWMAGAHGASDTSRST